MTGAPKIGDVVRTPEGRGIFEGVTSHRYAVRINGQLRGFDPLSVRRVQSHGTRDARTCTCGKHFKRPGGLDQHIAVERGRSRA